MHRTLQLCALLLPFAALSLPTSTAAQAGAPAYPAQPWPYAAADSSLRLDINPREARVYVDGYLAGRVDEFEGQRQRLRLPPGQHEIVIYLEGYRSLRQHLYLGPNTTRLMEATLEPLAAGERNEPEPVPAPVPTPPEARESAPPAFGNEPQPAPGPRSSLGPTPGPSRASIGPDTVTQYAALSVRVTPGRATIRVDNEQFESGTRSEHLILQVLQGRHVIQVERKGSEPFRTEVNVDAGETLPLNITLTKAE